MRIDAFLIQFSQRAQAEASKDRELDSDEKYARWSMPIPR